MNFSIAILLTTLTVIHCLKIDSKLSRIDKFLEQSYKLRNLRDLDLPQQEQRSFSPNNFSHDVRENEVEFDEADDEGTDEDDGRGNPERAIDQILGLEGDYETGEETRRNGEPQKMSESSEEDHSKGGDGTRRSGTPVQPSFPYPVPVVIQKLIPVPVMIPHPYPVPMLPMALPPGATKFLTPERFERV